MIFLTAIALVGNLTNPIPPGLDSNSPPPFYNSPPAPIYDSPDLYGAEPSVIALDLSTIKAKLYGLGFNPITSVEFVGGRWKIRAVYGRELRALEVNPDNGIIIADRPAKN
ncbi:hypothetical protein MO867_07570 [Microbulbifer sp. OS29]|uniref:PepSY domain-containing protein n=1 Tax=Microbulbifer okhotskensis TaxID=2926617 RepID=A0A9X2J787_9GAMM|nr:hypothetical protein [Microbulbifer okhotskensis]MCO1334201.1 hypothetical protein [Microbulbifer okhotskensis]